MRAKSWRRFVAMACAVVPCTLLACKSKPTPDKTPEPRPTSATTDARGATSAASATNPSGAAALPEGFPARGAPNVAGTLAGKRFDTKKAVLRLSGGANLALYNWSEGEPCDPQFAPNDDQLYIQVTFPESQLVVGAPIVSGQDGVVSIYKRTTLDPATGDVTTVVIDERTPTHATGRLLLTAPDGTKAAGSFDAPVCASPQQAATNPTEANGMRWGEIDVEPASLRCKPVSAVLLGKPSAPVAIEAIDWDDGGYSQHEIHFFLAKPAKPCGLDQMSPGFKIGFHGALAAGNTIKTRTTLVTHTGDPFGVVMWSEPGNVVGTEGGGWVSARIDAVSSTQVQGRVFAWFDDPAKSMIAGKFTATRCKNQP